MIKKIMFYVLSVIMILILSSLLLSKTLVVEKTVKMNCDVSAAFELVNTLPNWEIWANWKAVDPSLKSNYSNPIRGEGANYTWSGSKLGEGVLTITESIPNNAIKTKMELANKNVRYGIWHFESSGQFTSVSWKIEVKSKGIFGGLKSLMAKSQMENSIENGLNAIKTACE